LKAHKALLVSLAFLCLVSIIITQVEAQDAQIESEILPSQGGANTSILIRFRTKNATIGNLDKADIFWDNSTVALNLEGILGADGSYNYNLTVPTEPSLSYRGNHTIRVDSNVFNYGQVTFSFTFTITEFVPSPEYLALNATYQNLLANYTDLLNSYNQLLTNYSRTSIDYLELVNEHNQLLQDYNSLSANYNSLTANYNALSANYNSLLTGYNSLGQTYSSLLANYSSLQTSLGSLSSNYNGLRQNYDSLNSSYDSLKSNFDSTLGQLAISRDLNYILIASTIVLAVITIYLAIRKPRTASKTRHWTGLQASAKPANAHEPAKTGVP
jgi:hypothetical protein